MATSSISNLDSYYQNLINYTLTQEKQPITRLTKQKDDINVKKAVYTDLKTKFDTLQTAINALTQQSGNLCSNRRTFGYCFTNYQLEPRLPLLLLVLLFLPEHMHLSVTTLATGT